MKVLYNVKLNNINTDGTNINWVIKVLNLLCTHRFGEAWFNQGEDDANYFLN